MSSTLCACCGQPFEPRPQVPGQAYCSSPNCQRARKRQWQRAKLQSDSDYRINQRAAQQAWSQRNQEYWRDYRDARPEYAQRNAERRNIEIVRTYADEGKSGLRIDGRRALQQLIKDVETGNADFQIILVYDVSRWGRFDSESPRRAERV